jgi:hypothetical protein
MFLPSIAGALGARPIVWQQKHRLRAAGDKKHRLSCRRLHDFKERKENFRRIDPGSDSGSSGTPGIFSFLSKGRVAGGAASRE